MSLVLLFLLELMGWGECGSLLSHPSTVRESNGITGFKEAREDFQICRDEEPGIIVGDIMTAQLFSDLGHSKKKLLAYF